MQIKNVNMLYILLNCGNKIPPIFKHYMNSNRDKNLLYVLLNEHNEVIGVAVFNIKSHDSIELNYIYIFPKYQNEGFGKIFIAQLSEEFKKRGIKKCYSRTVLSEKSLKDIFISFGFFEINESNIIRCSVNEDNKKLWYKYVAKKYPIIEKWCLMNNIKIISFENADIDLKQTVFKGHNFLSNLDINIINNNNCGEFIESLSFIAYEKNEAIAYTIVTSLNEKSLIFAQINTSENYKGSGVAVATFFKSMEKIFESSYQTVSYTILSDNKSMLKLAKGMIENLTCKSTKQIYWEKNII